MLAFDKPTAKSTPHTAKQPAFVLHFQYSDARLRILPAARVIAWALAAAVIVLSVVPPNLRPKTDLPHDLEHFGIFCATGLAFGLGYRFRHGLLLACLVIFAGAVECAQLFVPGRHARLSDFIIDAVAACIGAIMVLLADRIGAGING